MLAIFHPQYARLLAPLLEEGQILFLNPGHSGGALEVKQILKEQGLAAKITLIETNTLTYITRKTGYNETTIFKVNNSVLFSALPACETPAVSQKIKELYPELVVGDSALETSLANFNAVMYIPLVILNAAAIGRTKGDFYFYSEGTTPAVGKVIEALDKDRMTIMKELGLSSNSFLEYFYQIGMTTKDDHESGSYYRVTKESPPNTKIKVPDSSKHRFFLDDIPYGITPHGKLE